MNGTVFAATGRSHLDYHFCLIVFKRIVLTALFHNNCAPKLESFSSAYEYQDLSDTPDVFVWISKICTRKLNVGTDVRT